MKFDRNNVLRNNLVTLEPASEDNVGLLIKWTLDPIAQGEYKIVPEMTSNELKDLFLRSEERQYFLIRNEKNKPIGRLYFREWKFNKNNEKIDWELNILIGEPSERGKGYGTQSQSLITGYLIELNETNSIFAYTMIDNLSERRTLEKIGFEKKGYLPSNYYKVDLEKLKSEEFVLYVYERKNKDINGIG